MQTDPKDTTNDPKIEYGCCHCGCGEKTHISKLTNRRHNQKAGEPRQFLPGHQARGKHNSSYNGGKSVVRGYTVIMRPGTHQGYDYEHRVIAEKVLGRPLKPPEEVHHHGPKADQCLVICPDRAYHGLLHARTRALEACGNPDYRKCWICKQWDNPDNMLKMGTKTHHHRECWNRYCYNKRHNIH